jgi:hypothetical protein
MGCDERCHRIIESGISTWLCNGQCIDQSEACHGKCFKSSLRLNCKNKCLDDLEKFICNGKKFIYLRTEKEIKEREREGDQRERDTERERQRGRKRGGERERGERERE